ncbi:MAG: ABC transporter ATP-binding protein [Gemmatimonadales bacterium]|nr:ABC transporter ATP-binding protein [Gemmatimonadales bacterium]
MATDDSTCDYDPDDVTTTPAKAAEPAKKKPKVDWSQAWPQARELLWQHRQRLLVGFGLMLVNRVCGLVLPASSKYFIDHLADPGAGTLLTPLAGAVLAATAVQAVTAFALSQVLGVAAQRAITDMRRRVQSHIIRLPVRRFDATQTGQLVSRIMADAEGIRNLIGTGLAQLVGGLLTAAVALGVLFWLDWRLTALTIVVLGAFGGGLAYAFKVLRPLFRERGQIQAEVTARLVESLGGIRVVKGYVAERREEYTFTKGANRLFRNIARSMTGVSATSAGSTVAIGLVGGMVIVIGGGSVAAGRMTVGDLVMYIFFIGLTAAPLVQLASIGTQVTEAFAGLDRIREILGYATEDDEDAERAPLEGIRGDVRFDGVRFEYEAGVPVLKGVSFDAPAGTTTALVGSSGSGKSTTLSLVMAFARPTEGRILIDGHDLRDIRLRDYRAQLGMVLQDNFLFDGTVAENIRFSRPDATRADVERVARIAHCHEFISGFPQGYDTVVGERGVKLSGGQRQRVAIARAILADPSILILDEATSSLDSEAEAGIQAALRKLREGRTTFVIAHRLSTITSADQILVMEEGEVVERGTHAELLAQGGRYRELYDRQYRTELDRFVNPGEELPDPEAVPARPAAPAAAR